MITVVCVKRTYADAAKIDPVIMEVSFIVGDAVETLVTGSPTYKIYQRDRSCLPGKSGGGGGYTSVSTTAFK